MDAIMSADWQNDLELIVEAAKQAGAVALSFFNRSPEVWWKNGDHSPVSAADFAANEKLSQVLRTARPGYGWLSEESEEDKIRLDRETLFVVDPIDGTRGFLAGQSLWCVSVAVVHRGRPVAGVLYAPALEEVYTAHSGSQALKNGSAISVSGANQSESSRFAIAEDVLKHLPEPFRGRIHRVKHVPSLAYRIAMVADGRIEGTYVKKNSHDWDLAAADLILEKAGGALTELTGAKLVYNRDSVSHAPLCAAPEGRLAEFTQALATLGSG